LPETDGQTDSRTWLDRLVGNADQEYILMPIKNIYTIYTSD